MLGALKQTFTMAEAEPIGPPAARGATTRTDLDFVGAITNLKPVGWNFLNGESSTVPAASCGARHVNAPSQQQSSPTRSQNLRSEIAGMPVPARRAWRSCCFEWNAVRSQGRADKPRNRVALITSLPLARSATSSRRNPTHSRQRKLQPSRNIPRRRPFQWATHFGQSRSSQCIGWVPFMMGMMGNSPLLVPANTACSQSNSSKMYCNAPVVHA
mmetsp:Transcript_18962/g.56605  ORF Transcript_18962/g.56605 Transcript_18962/m.56605 type:complete len:214 (-) Transcript_18962:122-763(-)